MGLVTGARIGPYEIVAPLGAGGMGEVYRARDARLAREVAIKVLPEASLADADRLRRFEDEARAAGQLNHPNILTVYDVGTHEGVPYIVSELLEGETLRSRLEQGALALRKAVDLARQTAEGLAAAHEKGIVHRDLKPENLFVTTDGRVKILDFGLAKLTRPGVTGQSGSDCATETLPGTVLGTMGYMSPEQVRGEAADHRSDLFSSGAILYEMLTGRPAFIRGTAADTMAAILKADLEGPPLTNVLPALKQIVFHCVETDPGARFQSARDLAFGLGSLPAASAHPGWRLGAWSLASAAAIVMAAIAAWFLLGRQSIGPPAIGAGGRPAVAVMTFDNPSGAPDVAWLTRGVPNMLTTALAQTPGLDVIGSTRVEAAARQIGGDATASDARRRAEIAGRSGAGALVTGSIFKAANEIRIDVQVEEIGSGRVMVAQSVRGTDVFALVDQLGAKIRSGLRVADEGATRGIADVTSRSLDAYKAYAAGIEARYNNRLADARRLLSQAVEIDPSFAMAHYELALLTRQTGNLALSARSLQQAIEHLDRLPPRHRQLIEAERASDADDQRRAVSLLEQLLQRYSDEEEAYYRLSTWYTDLNDTTALFGLFERAVKNIPRAGPLRNAYGFRLLRAARYDEALHQFDEYIRLAPDEPNAYDSMADAYVFAGDPEPALVKYAEALARDPSFFPSYRGRALALAQLGRYDEALADAAKWIELTDRGGLSVAQGRFVTAFLLSRVGRIAAARTEIAAGLANAINQADRLTESALNALSAWIALETGQAAIVRTDALRAIGPASTPTGLRREQVQAVSLLFAGLADLRERHAADARRRLAEMPRPQAPDPTVTYWTRALQGEIALASGDLVAADDAFAAAEPQTKMPWGDFAPIAAILANDLPSRDGRARVKTAHGDLTGAIAVYRSLLTPGRDRKLTSVLEPRFVLALARLLDRVGDSAGARAQYERFVALWHAADPGLSELEQAKRGLNGDRPRIQ